MGKEEVKNFKKKKLIVTLSIVSILVLVLLVFITLFCVGSDAAFNSQIGNVKKVLSEREELNKDKINIYKDENGYWNINSKKYDGILGGVNTQNHSSLLKVLHLTDTHFGSGYKSVLNDKKTMSAIEEMVKWAKPDLIIVTGDSIYPMPFTSGSINNGRSATNFCNFMNKFKIPWAFVYGNHDTESYATQSKEEISKILMQNEYDGINKFCLYQEGPNNFSTVRGGEKPLGNYPILLRENGNLKHVFMFMDSNKYNKDSQGPPFFKYDNIHKDQAEWYKNVIKKLSLDNRYTEVNPVTSSLYFHIPIKQYKEAWIQVTNDHIETEADKRKKTLIKDSPVKYFGGDMQEYTRDPKDTTISCSTLDAPIWDAVKDTKSTKFLFCGHDHDNNFSIEYEGIRLTYGKSVDYQAYPGISKRTFQRGCTLLLLTGDEGKDSMKIYQKKLVMLNKEQISDMNSQRDIMEDVYLNSENPKMMHPMVRIKLTASIIIICIVLLISYPIIKTIIKKSKNKKKK